MTPNEKKHVKAALDWLYDALAMIQRRDLVDTADSVWLAKLRLENALALAEASAPRKVKA